MRAAEFVINENFADGKHPEDQFSTITWRHKRRKLNVPALINAGAILVTYPHTKQGWDTDNKEDWSYSLISLYNVLQGGWPSEAKQYLKPKSYKKAEQQINSSAPNLGSDQLVYDGKYNQILWSIKKLGIPNKVAFLDDTQDVEENFADGRHPEDRGDSKRLGVPTKLSVSNLRKYAKSHSGRAAQLSHWAANMKAGRAKKKKTNEATVATINIGGIVVNMDDHALDRQQERGISNKSFDSAIRKLKLPRVINQMSKLEVGNRFYVLDHITNVALGMRKIGNAKYVLKTVVNGRPADYNIADIITV